MDETEIRARIIELETEIRALENLLPTNVDDPNSYFKGWASANVLISFNVPSVTAKVRERKKPKFRMLDHIKDE